MKLDIKSFISLIALSLFFSCASSSITVISGGGAKEKIKTIAISPGGSKLGDAVGMELSTFGYVIINSDSVSDLLFDLHIREGDATQLSNLSVFKEQDGFRAHRQMETRLRR